jgi:hypothetical protein
MVADQDPGSPQQLIQAPLMAVRLGSAHFDDVMIGFPSRGVDGGWECPTVIKVGKITQPWTLSSFRSPVEYFSGQYSGQKPCISGLASLNDISVCRRLLLGSRSLPYQLR